MADALANEVIAKIEQHGALEPGSVTLESELDTLGIHSLELTEIIFDMEDQYGIHVEMNTAEAWNSLRNVGDIVTAVRKLLAAKG